MKQDTSLPIALIVGVALVLVAAVVFVGVSIARNAAQRPLESGAPLVATPDASVSAVPQTASLTAVPTTPPRIPSHASDFTLYGAQEGAFVLSQQLAEGPVVLVFFRRPGG
ncbi:MAG: hypothetical protein GX601_16185 [Anaerolineales bacterium]|nr:hypothetical protein [Anaerolineales bacterium]